MVFKISFVSFLAIFVGAVRDNSHLDIIDTLSFLQHFSEASRLLSHHDKVQKQVLYEISKVLVANNITEQDLLKDLPKDDPKQVAKKEDAGNTAKKEDADQKA